MTGRAERKAAQREKIAAMPIWKRLAAVIAGGVAAVATGVVVGLLLEGEANVGLLVVLGISIMLILSYEYLVVPSRRSHGPRD
jgi:hypothetical protein